MPERLKNPPSRAFELSDYFAGTAHHRPAPIRRRFIKSFDGETPRLPALIKGGRGGEMRLKVLLTAIWLTTESRTKNKPYIDYPLATWAEMCGLNPEPAALRRVSDAISRLRSDEYFRVEVRPGQASRIFLLQEDGSEGLHTFPKDAPHGYLKIPAGLWVSQWIAALSGTAIWALLILLVERAETKPRWFPPRMTHDWYGISADTLSKGVKELEGFGLASTKRQRIRESPPDAPHYRNEYSLHLSVLDRTPPWNT